SVLKENGWKIELIKTSGGPNITNLAKQAVQMKVDTLFIAGGDGSIGYAVAGLAGSNTALAVLPAGTANVWAQELGLPGLSWTNLTALEETARILSRGVVKNVDVGICNGFPFLLWAGIGLDALIVHHIEPRSRLEKHFAIAQYAAQAVRSASFWRGMNLKIVADGEQISGRYVVAITSNIHLYAGGIAKISPGACLNDGEMDLWLFAGDTIQETIKHVWNLLSGKHVNSQDVRKVSFRELCLEADSQLYLQHDGEPMDVEHKVEIFVKPEALRVLIPSEAPRILFKEK
ncbi:MAG: hypothetical protein J7L73_02855, partial [Anaerolineales bacterium]|nr:hypothetical protein [Anaerolineales bacterium]